MLFSGNNMEPVLKDFFAICLAVGKCECSTGVSFTRGPSKGMLMYQDGVACKNSYVFSDVFIMPSGKYVVQSYYKAVARKQVFIKETYTSLSEVFNSLIKLQVDGDTVCQEVYHDFMENIMSKNGTLSQEEIVRSYISTFI